jgi:DNA-binding transcriptional LysR family regulator
MVIAPPDRWSAAELTQPLPISALASQSMIGITVRDALGSLLQSHLAKIDPPPKTAVAVQTYQLARSLVAKGEGVALVDPFTARCDASSVQMRPLKPFLEVVLYAMHRPDSPLNRVQKRFLQVVRQLAQGMLAKR